MKSSKIFAADLDETLTHGGESRIEEDVKKALLKLRNNGWLLVLATGRDKPYLMKREDIENIFDAWIMEGGLSIYIPSQNIYKVFVTSQWISFIESLRKTGFVKPKENTVTLRRENIEEVKRIAEKFQIAVSFRDNKGTIMLLPKGVNKAYALHKLMEILGVDGPIVVVGDSEIDLELFEEADFSVAVANAEDQIKAKADYVTRGADGEGVVEAVELILEKFSG